MFIKHLYLDLDGVFADFHRGVRDICGKEVHELSKNRMWSIVHSNKRFFATLKFMEGAEELWAGCARYDKTFLTGAPSSQAFRDQKKEWVAEKFGPQYPVIVLPRKQKQDYSGPGMVLLDDTLELINAWELKGGIGIHYKGNVKQALAQLKEADEVGYVMK